MKVVTFFIYLCSFLLSGGNPVTTPLHHNGNATSQHIEKSRHSKTTHTNQGFALIDDTDLDITEESHFGNDVKDGGSNKLQTGKYNLPQHLQISNIHLLVSNTINKGISSYLPVHRHTPIYITQGVLRI